MQVKTNSSSKQNSVNWRTYFKVAILLWVYPTKVSNLNTDQ